MAALVSLVSHEQILTGLRPEAYEHPLDTKALDALQKTPGLDTLIRKINEWGYERLLRVQLTGSYLRVTAENFPDLHDLLRQACNILDLPSTPDLYVAAGGNVNASTAGVTKPLILLYTGAIDLLEREELLFVIAHEIAHIKNGHVLIIRSLTVFPSSAD